MARKRPAWMACLLTATVLLVAGCGTISNLTDDGGMRCYGGVNYDVDQMVDSYERATNSAVYFAGLFAWCVDLPLSALGDTITLPYVVPVTLGWIGNYTRIPSEPVLRPLVDDSPGH